METGAATRSPTPSLDGQLVATKLHVPQPRRGLVPRPELVARLTSGERRKLTLVCAPAGWGKTILLSEWHASPEETRRFAWVSLDPGDDDPVRFWAYLIAALRTVEAELGGRALAALPSAGPALVDAVVAPLISELDALSSPLVLVLDDYHLVRNEQIQASIGFLLRQLPRSLQLALASRADPPLPLASLRAAGELTEIRAAELRFSDAEARALLNDSLELDLERPDVELLQGRTEGWAAGLQLAALSLRGQDDKRAFLDAFAGDDRQIGEYLSEVIADHPAPVRDFLLRTSILERLSAPLCDVVTGAGDAAEQLEAVERSNLFLVPLDTRREWYRYHHLFRDLLRHELERAEPELVPELHRRASAWHLSQGDASGAIEHASKAGDFADAGELIARYWRPVFNLGLVETVARWIDELPQEAVLADARLCLARGWVALYLGQLDATERWRQAAARAPLPGQLYDEIPSVAANAALLEAAHANATGDVGRGIDAARRSVSLDPDETRPTFGAANIVLGFCLYDAGCHTEAVHALEQGIRVLPAERWRHVILHGLGCLAAAYADLGDLDRAERAAADAERISDEFELGEAPGVLRTRLAQGKLLEQRGELAEAAASFARAVELARRVRRQLELAHALLLLARLQRRRREQAEARSLVREARAVLDACPDPGALGELLTRTERSLQLATAPAAAPLLPVDLELSERELTVLRLLAGELSQREIGSELYISVNTVKGHVRSIFRKLGVADRAAAVARGRELGLL